MLKIKNLFFERARTPVLKEMSFDLPSRKITLILGKSGSGKSTLLRCLAQLENTYQGEIIYEEQALKAMSPPQRCQTIGFVHQSFALFPHLTVLENCAHPLQRVQGVPASRIAAHKMLERLGMASFIKGYPGELSGGQQQRVAIARALLLNPAFLLFDEPTSALDPENRELFIKILQELCAQGKGIVIASQDIAFIKRVFNSAYFLEEGGLVERHEGALIKGSKLEKFMSCHE